MLGVLSLFIPVGVLAQAKPYSLDQVVTLLRGGISPSYILEQIRPNCILFRVDDNAVRVLRESGADDAFVSSLRQTCYLSDNLAVGTDSAAAVPLVYRPGHAALLSIVPGGGQFYTRRPILGITFLAAAAGAVAVGVQKQDLTVECLAHNAGSACPAGQTGREVSQQHPYLLPAVGAAAVLGIISGVVAFSTAVNVNRRAAQTARGQLDAAVRILPPTVAVAADGASVAFVRLRF
jgi:hypothetical protein